MNYYETLYIIHPALEAGRLKDIIMTVEDSLKKMDAAPLSVELWGKRKLAYFIDKQKYGTYVLVQYNGGGKCTRDFAVELEHNPNILAHLTTNIDAARCFRSSRTQSGKGRKRISIFVVNMPFAPLRLHQTRFLCDKVDTSDRSKLYW